MNKISLIGYGSWGKALLKLISIANPKAEIILCTRQNISNIEPRILITDDIVQAATADITIIATRAQEISRIVSTFNEHAIKANTVIITSKGFSNDGKLLSEAISNSILGDVMMLSGPNFASEILNDKLTIATLAGVNAIQYKALFETDFFKVQLCNDIIGVQVCSIMKNVFAIGCGIVFGGFNSDNTKAAFIIKAFNELIAIIEIFGGSSSTIYTPAGIGDLILTCYSNNSRNYEYGEKFIKQIPESEINTVEGYGSLMILQRYFNEKMLLSKGIYDLLNHQISLKEFGQIILS